MKKTNGVRGVQVSGEDPKVLLLSDGSALFLDADPEDGHGGDWILAGPDGLGRDQVSVAEAFALAGDEFARYVRVRTRAEVEWLRSVAEWCGERAELLTGDLETASRH